MDNNLVCKGYKELSVLFITEVYTSPNKIYINLIEKSLIYYLVTILYHMPLKTN